MEENEQVTEDTTESDSIWKKLGISDPEEEFEAEEDEQEVKAAKEDKAAKKLDKRVEDLEKKFRQDKLQEAKDKFLAVADPLEADLFKVIAGDAKDPEALDHSITLVKEKAAEMKKTMEEAEDQARKQAEKAWGVVNPGRTAQPTDDEAKKREEAIAKGDTVAGLAAIMEDDSFISGAL